MLSELRVENLLLIERAELRLAPGLNVLTGETGAGKTVLAHALDLLLGGRARPGIVRPGAAEAYVEGAFELPPALRGELGERLPADAEEVVLARRVGAEGRTRAYVNGRSAAVADLRELAGGLLAFFGQHEHRRLMLASAQLDILDGACGPGQAAERGACAAAHGRVREHEAALGELRELAGSRERELDLLTFELAEIEAAEPSETEEAELRAARERAAPRRGAAWRRARGRGGAAPRTRPAPRRRSPPAARGSMAPPGSTPRSTGSPSAGGRSPSRPTTSRASCAAMRRASRPTPARSRPWRSGSRSWTASPASTAGRWRRCSRTRRPAARGATSWRPRRRRSTRRARASRAARAELERHAEALRVARLEHAPRLATAVRDRLAELAMDGASFDIVVSRA